MCLQGAVPPICTTTLADGSFVLEAGGPLVDPCLTFTATDPTSFTGTVCISGTIPEGSVVRIDNIECSVAQGTCQADDVEVEQPDDTPTPSPSGTPSEDDGEPSVSGPDDDVSGVADDSEDGGDVDNSGSSSNSGPGGGDDDPVDD